MINQLSDRAQIFTEDALAYSLYTHRSTSGGQFFFKLHHNMSIRRGRPWFYWCAPEIDVIEVTPDNHVIAYELKGSRQHPSGLPDFPAIHDPIGQAVAYLDLPRICEGDRRLFEGGVFDFVYAVCARQGTEIDPGEMRTLSLVPVGAMFGLLDGGFVTIKEAPKNPLQNSEAKAHFLRNLDALENHKTQSKIFRQIRAAGEAWFSKGCIERGKRYDGRPRALAFLPAGLKKSATGTLSACASFTMVARDGLRLPRRIWERCPFEKSVSS